MTCVLQALDRLKSITIEFADFENLQFDVYIVKIHQGIQKLSSGCCWTPEHTLDTRAYDGHLSTPEHTHTLDT